MTARKAAHSLQRAKGALASGFATVDLHHATGHDLFLFRCGWIEPFCGIAALPPGQQGEPI